MPKTPTKKEIESDLDDALDHSFPASDPPSQTNPSRSTRTDKEGSKVPAKTK